jgi:proteasome lid subunit RPN8/RPN11
MVVEQAKGRTEEQVVGVLIGRLQNEVLVVEDAVSGEMQTNATKAVLTGETIARIADDIVNKKIKGNVIGWYHSHVRGGVFMSETDVETQLKLQQFSPYITAMVVDNDSGETGFYRADPKSKTGVRIPDQNVHVYTSGQDPIPPNWKRAAAPPEPATPMGQQYGPPGAGPYRPPIQPNMKTIIAVVALIAIILVGVLGFAVYYGGGVGGGGTLKIEHTPVTRAVVGNTITIRANVTGSGIQNVTLRFILVSIAAEEESAVWNSRNLRLESAEEDIYSYDITGSEVTGDIAYLITAYGSNDRTASTETFRIAVADFDFAEDQDIEVTVIRGLTAAFEVEMIARSSFTQSVSLRVDNRPAGVSLTFPSTTRPPGVVTFTARASADAELGEQDMQIVARFSIGAIQIERSQKVTILVTDFTLDLSPTLRKIDRTSCRSNLDESVANRECEVTLTLTVYHGFTPAINIEVRNLPTGLSYILVYENSRVVPEGVVTIRLIFITTSSIALQTYQLTIVATGGGVSESETLNLEIDD